MRAESTGEKWNRIGRRIQGMVLNAYPNPDRKGCLGFPAVLDFAMRVANWEEVEEDAEYNHLMHCSPCYAEFLDARALLRAADEVSAGPPKRLPRRVEKGMGHVLDHIEKALNSSSN